MQDKLKKASAVEKVQSDTIRDMSKGQKQLEIVRREHAELLEKVASVTNENVDLRKKVEEGAFEVKDAALRDAQERITELEGQLSRASVEVSELQERLKQERGALECELQQEIKAASKKEGELRTEIKDLEAKVEHYRAVSEVSLPAGTNTKDGNENALVHQIEVLQAQHSIASENWTGIETRLRDKISDLEKELESSKLQEVSLRKKYKELSQGSRLLSADKEHLHDQLSALRLELEVAFADHERTKLSAGETEKSLKSQLESLIARVDTLEKEKSALQQECEVLSSKIVDAERLAADLDATPPLLPPAEHPNDDVLDASSPLLGDGRTDRYRAVSGPPLSPAIDQQSSFVVDPVAFSSGAPTADISRVTSPSPGDMSRDYSSTSAAPPATSMQFVGKMNMTIRLLESELSQCRADLDKMRKEKESVYQEVAALFKTNEKLKVYETEVTDLRGEVDQLKAREQTALEMLGEKSELVNELRADVQDLKDMYRQQIEELVDQLQAAKAR
jgi:chromosome segregation ATPase